MRDDELSRPTAVEEWKELGWTSTGGKIHEQLSHDGTSLKKSVSRAPGSTSTCQRRGGQTTNTVVTFYRL